MSFLCVFCRLMEEAGRRRWSDLTSCWGDEKLEASKSKVPGLV